MSDALAVAATTRVLQSIVQQAVGLAVPGATVQTRPPERAGAGTGLEGAAVNLYLLQVAPNDAWRNEDLPTRGGDDALRRPARLALDLQYLLSFHGDDATLVPQRLLGAVLARFAAEPRLRPATLRAALAGDDPVAASTLAEQAESVTVGLHRISLEELSRLWSALGVPYALSMLYLVSVVVIDATGAVEPVEPVHLHGVHVRVGTGVPAAAGEVMAR